jgi:hypothetical protein
MQTDRRKGEGREEPKETIVKKRGPRPMFIVFPLQATKNQSEEEYKIF